MDWSRQWSYYGAAHRYDIHSDPDVQRRCEETMRRLRERGAESELRQRAQEGDRCAFVALVEILVDEDRTDDLRALADGGDDRARTTLLEMLCIRGREDELRVEVAAGRAGLAWLVDYLSGRGRLNDALDELAGRVAEHPDDAAWAHARRLDLLLAHGRAADVRREAEAGDRAAIRRMRHPY